MRAYHFLASSHALDDIARRRLKISRWADLNDPFELAVFDTSDPEIALGFERYKVEWDRKHGLLCFARTWSNPLLWSHYADKHRGIVLGFDVSDSDFNGISYVTERPVISAPPTLDTVHRLMFSKFREWQYEDEVRAQCNLDPEDVESGGLRFVSFSGRLALREVILGVRCVTLVSEVQALVRDWMPRVKVIRTMLAASSFKVVARADS